MAEARTGGDNRYSRGCREPIVRAAIIAPQHDPHSFRHHSQEPPWIRAHDCNTSRKPEPVSLNAIRPPKTAVVVRTTPPLDILGCDSGIAIRQTEPSLFVVIPYTFDQCDPFVDRHWNEAVKYNHIADSNWSNRTHHPGHECNRVLRPPRAHEEQKDATRQEQGQK